MILYYNIIIFYNYCIFIHYTSLFFSFVKYLPPKSHSNMNKKTLVLDLDETLVHSGFKPFPTNSDIILKIELDNKNYDIHVLVRPGVEEFLDRMAKHYELVVFTASLSKVSHIIHYIFYMIYMSCYLFHFVTYLS